jgi:hypothetical protein
MVDLQTGAHPTDRSLENAPARFARIQLQLDLLRQQARELAGTLDKGIESLEQQLDRALEQTLRAAITG